MKKIILLFVLVFYSLPFFSQEKSISLNWEGDFSYSPGNYVLTVPSFTPVENYSFEPSTGIAFVKQWNESRLVAENSVRVSNVSYLPLTLSDLKDLELNTIPEKLKFSLKNAKAGSDNSVVFTLSPIIKEGDFYKKVTSFRVNYSFSNSSLSRLSQSQTISNSVLSNGDWFKFEVEKTGVHKISKSFLSQLGVRVNGLDPRTIKLYGNGGMMMPYSNSVDFPLDPQENAIKIVGEEDGAFDDSDYILFYAQGPTADVNASKINTNINPYSETTVYYINISSGLGKRVTDAPVLTGQSNVVFNTFNDFQFHEVDKENLVYVGRRWFGERFDVNSRQSFNFDFPNLIASSGVQIKVVAGAVSSNPTSFDISVNDISNNSWSLDLASTRDGVYATDGEEVINVDDQVVNGDNINVRLDYNNLGNPSAISYLDYITVKATRGLSFEGQQFVFKNNDSAQSNGVASYVMSNAANVQEIWDVTSPYDVVSVASANTNSTLTFKSQTGILKTYAVVSSQDYYLPIQGVGGRFDNQDLKGTVFLNDQGAFQDVDYLMLTTRSHLVQAERLAQINRDYNSLHVKVVVLEDIFNEFSSGNPDIAGVRNFVKYVYGNASQSSKRLKYVCIFGDTSFDYKARISSNKYNFPSWHAYSSLRLSNSFVSDDFYGYMDFAEGDLDYYSSSSKLDIAMGRIIADSPLRAKEMVDKVLMYYSRGSLGNWRNNFVAISDDLDFAWEEMLQETVNGIADEIVDSKPFVNATKILSDSYEQKSSAGGERYPDVTEAISNAMERGAIVVNYFGHGGEDGLSGERIFLKPNINALNNFGKLNLFVTVTCEFTRFDNPIRLTAGELIFWKKNAGSIGLITTTRQVSAGYGKKFNEVLQRYLFSYSDDDIYGDGEYPGIGEALRLTKNSPDSAGSQINLVFCIGDPALKLAVPKPNIRLTKINDVSVNQSSEVLKALDYVKLSGEVVDVSGSLLSDYNGVLTTTIYDKEIDRVTLGNDNTSNNSGLILLNYKSQGAVIFRGQATIVNGKFDFNFMVPKDISVPVGLGKVSFYAVKDNTIEDKSGANILDLRIGGVNTSAQEDNTPPVINLFMNDETFVPGGVTNTSPSLVVKFEDENGINTASGVGHDIVAILDGDEINPYVLNDYYLTDVDDYTKGSLVYPFRDLKPGLHTLMVKAWDVHNNSTVTEIQFVVHDENVELVLTNVLNYPNPFVDYTEFWFSHNSSDVLDVSVQVFTVSGKLVRTLNGQTTYSGFNSVRATSRDIVWDGRDDFGQKIGKGTYIYKLKAYSPATNKSAEKIEKLVIL